MSHLALFELEPIGINGTLEANGRVYYFCSTLCQALFDYDEITSAPLAPGISEDAIEGTVCDQCGAVLQ